MDGRPEDEGHLLSVGKFVLVRGLHLTEDKGDSTAIHKNNVGIKGHECCAPESCRRCRSGHSEQISSRFIGFHSLFYSSRLDAATAWKVQCVRHGCAHVNEWVCARVSMLVRVCKCDSVFAFSCVQECVFAYVSHVGATVPVSLF